MLHTIKSNDTCHLFSASKANLFFHIFSLMVGVGDFWLFLKSFLCAHFTELYYMYPVFYLFYFAIDFLFLAV